MKNTGPLADESDSPGVPCLRSWRAVYVFVLAAFVLWIVLLVALERTFS